MASDIRQAFGKRVRQLRRKQGWSQVVMAEKLGLARSYVVEIEQGKRNVSLLNLEVIADGFQISVSKLLSRL